MSITHIIAFTGFKQTGKSTAASFLEREYGFVRHSFKDALIAHMKERFPDTLALLAKHYGQTVDNLFIEKPPIMRALMQNVGTDDRRRDNPDYWTDAWEYSLEYALPENTKVVTKVVVDDVRFLNEAQAVKDLGGIIIRLIRPDITTGGTHVSETEMLQIEPDHTIECVPGNHEVLYTALRAIVE